MAYSVFVSYILKRWMVQFRMVI